MPPEWPPWLPPSIKVEHVEGKRKLEDLLTAGEIDAEVEPDLPRGWLGEETKLQRLFTDFAQAERDYYHKTRIFPIMHPLVVKKDILERDPWVATSLFEAFCAARNLYNDFVQQPHRLSFAWGRAYLEEERKFFGGPQGQKKNRHDLETMVQFACEQHLTPAPLSAEELFHGKYQKHIASNALTGCN